MKKVTGIFVLLVLMTVAFTTANAQVFLGKGDVQTALGYNSEQLNASASSLVFTYEIATSYSVTIEWTTETGGKESKTIDHAVTHHGSATVDASVSASTRKNSQDLVTGFWLTVGSLSTTGGSLPVVGELYVNPGGNTLGNGAIVTDVTSEGTTGGLKVNGVLIPSFVL